VNSPCHPDGDLITILTTDAVAESVDFVERSAALPGPPAPAAAPVTAGRDAAPAQHHPRQVATAVSDRTRIIAAGESRSVMQVHETRLRVRVRDRALMLYTSGTTANPKGCLLTHEAMVRNSIALGRHRYLLTREDRMWSPLPMFHIAAVLPMLAIFDVGGTYLTMGYFDAGVALKMIQKYQVTALYPAFVTIMQGLIYHPSFPKVDFTRVRLVNSNFAVQPPGVAEPIMKAMPNALQVGSFGMTEAAGTVCTGAWDEPEKQRITRLGRPLPGPNAHHRSRDGCRTCRRASAAKSSGAIRSTAITRMRRNPPGDRSRRLVSHRRHRLLDAQVRDVSWAIQGHAQGRGRTWQPREIEASLGRHPCSQAGAGRRRS
jgi:fatty-acyl-CoA synthase/long-chain acyl-CoA synthetase